MFEVGSATPTLFTSILKELNDEETVKKSTKGPKVIAMVEAFLSNSNAAEVLEFGASISDKINSCLSTNRAGHLAAATLWRHYHVLRLSSTRSQWQACTVSFHLDEEVLAVSDLVLQLVLKRMVRSVVQQLTISSNSILSSLSLRECNVVRYIAGYIIAKMKKKFKLQSQFFDTFVVTTFDYMSTSSIQEYSRMWVAQINRGGLYNVNEEFYCLLKQFEIVCRKFLDVRVDQPERLTDVISKNVMASPSVTSLWTRLSSSIPESNRECFLEAMIKLWLNIRVHSFAHDWGDVLCKKLATEEKALRKSSQLKTCMIDTSEQ